MNINQFKIDKFDDYTLIRNENDKIEVRYKGAFLESVKQGSLVMVLLDKINELSGENKELSDSLDTVE